MRVMKMNMDTKAMLLILGLGLITFGTVVGLGKRSQMDTMEASTEAAVETATEAATEATTEEVWRPSEIAEDGSYTIVIDPGHGGNDTGVSFHSDEGTVNEKTVNMKVARYLKKYLEEYENVTVLLTRDKDKYLSLDERVDYAKEQEADLFISLHNNSLEDAGGYASGCSVCVAMGNYKEELGLETQKLGCNFVYELGKLGLRKNGLVMRSAKDYDYPNGRAADYFATVRKCVENNIVSVIVEHGFLDNPDDFYDYLCSKKQLKKLAQADEKAIARYLQLKKAETGEVLKPLSNYQVKIAHIRRAKSTRRFKKTYYKE